MAYASMGPFNPPCLPAFVCPAPRPDLRPLSPQERAMTAPKDGLSKQDDSISTTDDILEGPERYLAYAFRVGRLLSKVSRYSAYASDVGEAFRPIVPVSVVNASYGIAFGYVGYDIAYNGYRAQKENRDVSRAVAHATVFQGLASLAAPYLIIHTTVSVATKTFNQMKRFQRWGPTVAGLSLIPLLPSMVDEPIEEAVEWAFHTYWPEQHHGGGSSGGGHGGSTATTTTPLEKKHA